MNLIENVDWQITSQCSRCCSYCFGPKEKPSVSLSVAYKIIDQLAEIGTKQIGITGGEPLLYPFFPELINHISQSGIRIYLSTNCDYYATFSDLIKSNVSILGIPLDGGNPNTHDRLRGKDSFSSVIHVLEDIQNSDSATKIKIGTVITNENYAELDKIEQLLAPYREKIIFWKLYELICYQRNKEGVAKLSVNPIDTTGLGELIGKEKVIYDTLEMRDRSYFFISPNGDVFVPLLMKNCSKEIIIGNMVSDGMETIVKRFNQIVNTEGYNSECRYMRV